MDVILRLNLSLASASCDPVAIKSRHLGISIYEDDLGASAKLLGFSEIMKAEYESIMARAVAARLQNAESLGIKASWSTAHHLGAVADVIDAALGGPNEKAKGIILAALSETYNISAFQQMLAKKFAPTGHFQRESKPSAKAAVDSFMAMVETAKTPTAPAPAPEQNQG